METINDYLISGEWTDINNLSGIEIGQQLIIHNAGRAGDVIEVAISELEPSIGFRGVAIKSLTPQYRIAPQEYTTWVRYIRYDLNGTITPKPQHKCLINIQTSGDIEEISSFPSRLIDGDRVKVLSGSLADTINIQLSDVTLSAGSTVQISIENISEIPLTINQMSLFSLCPNPSMIGKSSVSLDMYFNVNTTGTPEVSGISSAFSNSKDGSMFNIKGFLIDINSLESLDVMQNSTFVQLDNTCIVNGENVFVSYNDNKVFADNLYIGAGKSVVIYAKNTAIENLGVDANMDLTLSGQFQTAKGGIPYVPLSVDTTLITVDSDTITVDKTEL